MEVVGSGWVGISDVRLERALNTRRRFELKTLRRSAAPILQSKATSLHPGAAAYRHLHRRRRRRHRQHHHHRLPLLRVWVVHRRSQLQPLLSRTHHSRKPLQQRQTERQRQASDRPVAGTTDTSTEPPLALLLRPAADEPTTEQRITQLLSLSLNSALASNDV